MPLNVSYTYFARPDESKHPMGFYDGDTMDVIIDIGFGVSIKHRLRLLGIDTPELRGDDRERGLVSRDAARGWMVIEMDHGEDWPLIIQTEKSDSFGRYLATVTSAETGESLNQFLLDNHYADPYEK